MAHELLRVAHCAAWTRIGLKQVLLGEICHQFTLLGLILGVAQLLHDQFIVLVCGGSDVVVLLVADL